MKRQHKELNSPKSTQSTQEEAQLNIKSFDMGVMFLPSRLPPKRPLPMDYDSDDSDYASAAPATGGGGAAAAAPAATVPPPFSCDPDGVLFREKPLSYRCPDLAPAPRLKTLPLGLLPIPQQLPGECDGGGFVGLSFGRVETDVFRSCLQLR